MMRRFFYALCSWLLTCSLAHAAVAFESCSTSATGEHSGAIVLNFTSITAMGPTVTFGNAVVLLVIVGSNNTISGVSANWDPGTTNQAMTAVAGSPAVNGNESIYAFGLLAPTTGQHNFNVAWTTNGQVGIFACSMTGVDTSSFANAFPHFNSATNGTPISVTVTAGANDGVFAAFSSLANFTTTNQTQRAIDNAMNQWASAFNTATGANPTMTGNPGSATSLAAGVDIAAPAGGGATASCTGGGGSPTMQLLLLLNGC